MGETITERLAILVANSEHRSRRAFAQAAGLNEVSFNDNLRKGTEPRYNTLLAILTAYPKVSAEWLMRGKGDMFLPDEADVEAMERDEAATEGDGLSSDITEQLRQEVRILRDQLAKKDAVIDWFLKNQK